MYHSVVKVKKNRRLEFLKIKLQSSICFYEVVANICLQKVMQQVVCGGYVSDPVDIYLVTFPKAPCWDHYSF